MVHSKKINIMNFKDALLFIQMKMLDVFHRNKDLFSDECLREIDNEIFKIVFFSMLS